MNAIFAIIAIVVMLTWYDGPGPKTACGDKFNTEAMAVAAPLSLDYSCGDKISLCSGTVCVVATVWDRIPEASAAKYNGFVLDGTPAVLDALGIPYGVTESGVAYGRKKVTVYQNRQVEYHNARVHYWYQ